MCKATPVGTLLTAVSGNCELKVALRLDVNVALKRDSLMILAIYFINTHLPMYSGSLQNEQFTFTQLREPGNPDLANLSD